MSPSNEETTNANIDSGEPTAQLLKPGVVTVLVERTEEKENARNEDREERVSKR
jgi:hypothetical protein